MNRKKYLALFFLITVAACISLVQPTAATTELHIVKYADDHTTVINETTVTWQWMRDNLPVLGDGTTHYYHQGPVFVDDAANPTHQEELRWNLPEDTNVQEKDYGAVKGTNLKDLCNLVGGLSPGEEVTLKAIDGFNKKFAYRNVYEYTSRQGPMVITWSRDGSTPDTGYDEGMKLVFFADTSLNPWGIHAFGNYDWHESADSSYWYYYYQGTSNKYPTTTGLSVKYISDIIIYSTTPASEVHPPAAAFSATPVSGTAPLTVQFTDLSTGTQGGWAWDFTGDGSVDSTEQSPSYSFTTPGTYTVILTAMNSYGSTSETKSGYITVSPSGAAPVAAFSATPVSGTAPLTVQFTDLSTGTPGGWAWDFTGDGSVDSTEQSPSYSFTTAGTYTVKLTATNSHGSANETKSGYITVSAPSGTAPVAMFSTTPISGPAPLTVHFTDHSTGSPASWSWDFTTDGVIDSTAASPSFTYINGGTYTASLTVTNSAGATAQNSSSIQVVGQQPAAGFSADVTTGSLPLVVQFADSSTGNGITAWAWDFDSNGVIDSTEKNPRHTYSVAGIYPVKLTVSGTYGTSSVVKERFIRVTKERSDSTGDMTAVQEPAVDATAPAVVTSSLQHTTVKKTKTTTPNLPAMSEVPAESPGPDAAIITVTLIISGLGAGLVRYYLQLKR